MNDVAEHSSDCIRHYSKQIWKSENEQIFKRIYNIILMDTSTCQKNII